MRVLLILAGLIALGLGAALTFHSIVTEVSYSEPIPGIPGELHMIQYTIVTYPYYGLGLPLFIAGLILVLKSLRFSPEAHRMP
jgi:hypothetical protein